MGHRRDEHGEKFFRDEEKLRCWKISSPPSSAKDGQKEEKEEDEEYTPEEIAFLKSITESPAKFCHSVLGLRPFPYQEKFLEDKSKKIIACAGRQVGKSLISAAKALWFSLAYPKSSTLIVSATQRQSSLMFEKIVEYIESSQLLEESVLRGTRTKILFSNGSKIAALPCGRHGASLRGHTANLILIDEASFVPEEVITQVMNPMLSTTDGTMIMISTPYDKAHYFYRMFNSPNWSKYHFKTSENPKVKPEFLKEQREEIGERQFRQEYLAEFVDDEKTYFPMELLRSAVHLCGDEKKSCDYCLVISGAKDPSGELYAGYDPGGMTDPAALVVAEKLKASETDDSKPAFRVVLTKTLLVKQRGKNNSSSDVYTQFTVEISDLHKKLHFKRVLVDSTGLGSPILSHCKELQLPVEGVNLNRVRQEQIFSNLKILFEQKKVALPDSLNLLSSLNCIVAKRNRIGGYSFDHLSGTHDDLAFALALAVWAGRQSASMVMMKHDNPGTGDSWKESMKS